MSSVDTSTSPRCSKAMSSSFVLTFMLGALLASLGAQAQSTEQTTSAAPAVVMNAPSAEPKDEHFPVGEMVQKMNDRQIARFEKKHAQFKQLLNLSPAQEPLWDHFTQSVRSMAPQKPTLDRVQMRELTQLPAPQRAQRMMDLQEAHHDQMLSKMKAHLEAMKVFYAQLSVEQQKSFDQWTLKHQRPAMRERGGMRPPI